MYIMVPKLQWLSYLSVPQVKGIKLALQFSLSLL